MCGGPADVELTTPTGAALLKTLGKPSPLWPEMRMDTVAYGAGARDLEGLPNVLRLAVGNTGTGHETDSDHVWLLELNVDDMTGEEVGFCTERLLNAGALDVFTTAIQMKKNRPGLKISVLCDPTALGSVERLIWRHSSTLGLRRTVWQRSKLRRESRTVTTQWGEVRVKTAYLGEDLVRCEPEYDDCCRIAAEKDIPLRQVYAAARRAFTE